MYKLLRCNHNTFRVLLVGFCFIASLDLSSTKLEQGELLSFSVKSCMRGQFWDDLHCLTYIFLKIYLAFRIWSDTSIWRRSPIGQKSSLLFVAVWAFRSANSRDVTWFILLLIMFSIAVAQIKETLCPELKCTS